MRRVAKVLSLSKGRRKQKEEDKRSKRPFFSGERGLSVFPRPPWALSDFFVPDPVSFDASHTQLLGHRPSLSFSLLITHSHHSSLHSTDQD